MKKIIILILAVVGSVCFAFGCGADNGTKAELSGFDVTEEETRELGSVYTIDKPFVYDTDRNFYEVSIAAEHNGDTVEVVGGMIELSETGDYVITYSVNFNGKPIVKTTTIKVSDSVAPVISFGELPKRVGVGDTVDLSGVTAIDYSGVKTFEKSVVDDEGNPVTLTNGGFVVQKNGVYTINAVATDESDNETEESYKIEAHSENQIYTFNTESDISNFGFDDRYCLEPETVTNAHGLNGGCMKITPLQGWFYITWLSMGYSAEYEIDLSSEKYKDYTEVYFDVYFETTSAAATVFDFNGKQTSVAVNTWVTVGMDIKQFNNGSVNYTALWADPVTAAYIANVRLEKFNPIKYDFENGDSSGDFATNQGSAVMATDPENANNRVLLWKANAKWAALYFNNFNGEQLKSEKYDGYNTFTMKVYIKADGAKVDSFNVFGISKGPVETNKWVTITVNLDDVKNSATKYADIWDSELNSYDVYFDDIGVCK